MLADQRVFAGVVTALILAAVALPVRADIVILDLDDPGDQLLKFDTETGLYWLAMRATWPVPYGPADYSVDDILSGAGGWIGRGFRYANEAEVLAYRDHLVAQAYSESTVPIEQILALYALVPTTGVIGMTVYAYAAYEDGGSTEFYGSAGWAYTVMNPILTFGNANDVIHVTVPGSIPSRPRAHWLVTTTPPIPAVPGLGLSAQLMLSAAMAAIGGAFAKTGWRGGPPSNLAQLPRQAVRHS